MQFQIDNVSSKATLIKRNKIKRIIVATIWLLARGMKKYKFYKKIILNEKFTRNNNKSNLNKKIKVSLSGKTKIISGNIFAKEKGNSQIKVKAGQKIIGKIKTSNK